MNSLVRLTLLLFFCISANASFADIKSDVAEFYHQASLFIEDNEYPSAIISLKNALQLDPEHLASRILLGKVYVASRNGAEAEKELLLANSLGADEHLTMLPLAQAFNLQHRYDDVILKLANKVFPRTIEKALSYELGQAYLVTGEIDQALKSFNQILDRDGSDSKGLQGKSLVLMALGSIQEAEEYALKAHQFSTDKSQTSYLLAKIASSQLQTDKALQYYNEALSISKDHYNARMDRGSLYLQQRDYVMAISDFQYLINRAPYDPKPHYLLGIASRSMGDVDTAKDAFSKASTAIFAYEKAIEKEEPDILLLAAAIASVNDKLLESIAHYQTYLKTHPRHLGIRKKVARLMLKTGDASKVVKLFRHASLEQAEDAEVYALLGEAYVQLKQYNKSVQSFEKSLQINPRQAAVVAQLGKSQIMTGKKEDGFKNLQTIADHSPKARSVSIYLAMQYFKEGKLIEAKKVTSQLIEQDAKNLSALSIHASILGSMGDLRGSRNYFNKILLIQPDFRSAKLNLIKIDLKEGNADKARESLTTLLAEAPDDDVLLYEQVKLEQNTGNMELAVRLLEKLYQKDKAALVVGLHLIDLYFATKQIDRALDLVHQLKRTYPEETRVIERQGKAYLLKGDKKTAGVIFKKMAEEAGYNDAKRLFEIALLQVRADRLDDARWSLQKSIDAQPNAYTAIVTLAELQIQTGRLGKAEALISRLRLLNAKHPSLFLLEASLATKKGDKQAAVLAYRKAHGAINSSKTAIDLFKALLSAGDSNQAVNILESWSKAHPNSLNIKRILGDFHFALGEEKKAQVYFEDIVKTNHANADIYASLALIYFDQGNDLAMPYAAKAYELAPKNANALDAYGWLLVQSGDVKQGLSMLINAVSRNSQSPSIYYHLGEAYERSGRKKKAIETFKKALSFEQNFKGKEIVEKHFLQ